MRKGPSGLFNIADDGVGIANVCDTFLQKCDPLQHGIRSLCLDLFGFCFGYVYFLIQKLPWIAEVRRNICDTDTLDLPSDFKQ